MSQLILLLRLLPGRIPSQLGMLTALNWLDFDTNQLTGDNSNNSNNSNDVAA